MTTPPTDACSQATAAAPAHVAAGVVESIAGALYELGHREPVVDGRCRAGEEGVPVAELQQLWARAALGLHNDHIALAVLDRLPAGALGLLDHGLIASPDLRHGFQLLSRFMALFDESLALDTVDDGRHVTIVLSRPRGQPPCRHSDELVVAWLVDRMRHGLVRHAVVATVGFVHPPVTAARMLERHFSAEIRFDASRTYLRMPTSLVDEPLRTAASSVFETVRTALAEAAREDAWLVRVRELVAARGAAVTIDEVAAALGTSSRSLQRELQARARSFRRVVDEVRCERALRLIRTSDADDATLAAELGYHDASSFVRAFRRWTGEAPDEHRVGPRSARSVTSASLGR